MPPGRDDFDGTPGRLPSALNGRILGAPAIHRSRNAWAATVYNAEGLIVSAPDSSAAAALGGTLREVLAEFACAPDGPSWLRAPEEATDRPALLDAAPGAADSADGVLAAGVKFVVGNGGEPDATTTVPDPWPIVETLRTRLGPGGGSVGLNHLMSCAEQFGGNPLAVGHGRVGLDAYGSAGFGAHGPVGLMVHPRPKAPGRRPRVVVLDTGIGDHPWFRTDPAETTVCFADGTVVGPDIARSPRRAAPAAIAEKAVVGKAVVGKAVADRGTAGQGTAGQGMAGQDATARPGTPGAEAARDTARIDPLLGILPTHTGHGTFIAGLLRQACPAAEIVALTVMGADGFVPEHKLIRALDVLRARQRESPGWADAIVLSLGYYAETGEDARYSSGLKEILLDLGRLGVAVFAAAGNDASRRPSYPAAFAIDEDFADPDVLPVVSVAALTPDGSVAAFSNDGPWVTAEALGVNLVSSSPVFPAGGTQPAFSTLGPDGRRRSSLDPDDFRSGFAVWSGTSFAAPVLAGEYLRRLLTHGFPSRNRDRRALLPVGRRSPVTAVPLDDSLVVV